NRDRKTSRVTLEAVTPTDAVREADRLRVVSEEGWPGAGPRRLPALAGRCAARSAWVDYESPRGRLAASTLSLYDQRIESHVLPTFGEGTRVRDIRAEHLRKLVDRMRLAGPPGVTTGG